MKRLMSIAFSCLIAFGMLPTAGFYVPDWQAYAEDKSDTSSTIEEIAGQLAEDGTDPFDYTQESAKKKAIRTANRNYPDSFDLRDVGGQSYVTPVKFQEPFGNCWGFAAISAAETSILGNDELRGDYVADSRKEAGIQMDLSEKHLSFFARTPLNDPSNPQNGEGVSPYVDEGEDAASAAYNMGAHAPTATSLFASGIGPVLESVDPIFEYKGRKGTRQKEWVDGKFEDFCYSDKDDWSLDESLRFTASYSLKESFVVPSPADVEQGVTPDDSKYEYNPAGTAAIKEQLLHKRGVQIGYAEDTFNPKLNETHGEYISNNWAHYTFIPDSPKHAVTIVGWDDNYSRENFGYEPDPDEDFTAEDTMPPADMFPDGRHEGETNGGNGAWLVKNSWGSGEESFPNKSEGYWGIQVQKTDENGDPVYDINGDPVMTGSGYFWLSYYDQSIATPEALDFDQVTDDTDIIDQHDFLPIDEYNSAHVESEVKIANVFKAGVCEELRQVSCETVYPGTGVTYEIYLLADGHKDPTDGLLMDVIEEGPYEYGGFHKSNLNKPFTVMRGQSYSIVVTQKVPENGGGESYAFSLRQAYSGEGIINEGESYVLADGKWYDFGDKGFRDTLMSDLDPEYSNHVIDNFPIKGYTKEKPDIVLEVGFSGYMGISRDGQVSGFLKAWLTDNSGGDYEITPVWSIAEGGEDVIELKDGRDPTRKSLLCKKLGGTYVIVTAEGVGTVLYPVVVDMSSPDVTEVKTGADSITITTDDDFSVGIEGYELLYKEEGASEWMSKTFEASNTLVLDKLKKGSKYELELRYFAETAGRKYFSYEYEGVSDTVGTKDTPQADEKSDGINNTPQAGGKTVGLKNTLKASGKTVKLKYKKLKKSKRTIKRGKAIKVSGAKGTVRYKKIGGNKKIKINAKSGKITVKKGLKKGKYKLKVRVTAAGNGSYLSGSKKVTVIIKVK